MKKIIRYILFIILCAPCLDTNGQQPPTPSTVSPSNNDESKKSIKKKSQLSTATKELEKSLEKEDEVEQAASYNKVGNELMKNDMPEKAEQYFQKAEKIYKRNSMPAEAAASSRNLAISQEEQNKKDAAAASYKRASSMSEDQVQQQLNTADANRLRQPGIANAPTNIPTNNKTIIDNAVEGVMTPSERQRVAEMAVSNPIPVAIDLSDALRSRKINEKSVIKTAKDATEVLIKNNKLSEAILFNEKILQTLQGTDDKAALVAQLLLLGKLKNEQNNSPISYYKEAYRIATTIPSVIASRDALSALLLHYYQSGNSQDAELLKDDFLSKVDSIIANDAQHNDLKKFALNEQRIAQLEKEKELQAATIKQGKLLNNILIITMVGTLAFVGYVIYANRKVNIKNKRIALQSLRREMNPHFIFNSLNSINEYIVNNDERRANSFLTRYATLMRRVMDHNSQDFVSIAVEQELLEQYLALEHLRFSEKFDYSIYVDPALVERAIMIPNMVLQPYLENAIWHGLRYRQDKGMLTLNISEENNMVRAIIKDNGIGIEASKAFKTRHQKDYKSLGMTNTRDRLVLINSLYHTEIKTHVTSDHNGTTVTITIPTLS